MRTTSPERSGEAGLQKHSFYFFILSPNQAETESNEIMQHVMEGDVDL